MPLQYIHMLFPLEAHSPRSLTIKAYIAIEPRIEYLRIVHLMMPFVKHKTGYLSKNLIAD